MAVSLAACGGSTSVSQDEYDDVVAERDELEDDLSDLQYQLDDLDEAAALIDLLNLSAATEVIDISGLGDSVTLTVTGLTSYYDELTVTIVGDGAGTLTFRFLDSDDVVTLDGDSDISSFTAIAIVGGTVDLRAVDISGVDVITIASGVELTASQFLSIDSIEINSDEGSLSIYVSTEAEAEAVIAAMSKVTGSGAGADTVELAASDGAEEGLDIDALNDAADDEINGNMASSELPDLIEALSSANQAVIDADDAIADFLDANDAEDSDGIEGAEYDALDALDSAVADAIDGADFTDASAAVRGTLISSARSSYEGANTVLAAQEQEALDALVDGVVELIEAADLAITAFHDAVEATDDADTDVQMAIAAANAVNGVIDGLDADLLWDDGDGTLIWNGEVYVGGDAVDAVAFDIATYDADDAEWLIVDAGDILDAFPDGANEDDVTAFLDFLNDIGISDIIEALNAYDGAVAIQDGLFDDAVDAVSEAIITQADDEDAVVDADAVQAAVSNGADGLDWVAASDDGADVSDAIIAYLDALADSADGILDLAAFNDAVSDWEDAVALLAEYDGLADDLDDVDAELVDAQDAFGDFGLTLETAAFDGTLDATDGSDVFVFEGNADNIVTIDDFGVDGVDYIVMDDVYTFVDITDFGDDATIEDRIGDADVLEIFYFQDGADLTLYVEMDAESGRDTSDDDITTIVLSGIEFSDLTISGAILSAEGVAA